MEHKLMDDNITRENLDKVIEFLKQEPIPILTNASPKIKELEKAWSDWLGVKYSVFVGSGTDANFLTIAGLKRLFPNGGEILVPTITWVSDIVSVLNHGFTPVFIDSNLSNLGMNIDHIERKITSNTVAIFLTHALGFNCLSQTLLDVCNRNNILLIEDCCEGYPVYFQGKKTGTFGFASNFSFFAAHHASCGEGGMISTNDYDFFQYLLANRSHSMIREMTDEKIKQKFISENPLLNKDFIFIDPMGNFRNTAISAVIMLDQMRTLEENGKKRAINFERFLANLDSNIYRTDFDLEGQNNYAFILMLKDGNIERRNRVEKIMDENNIQYRRGCSSGGNQVFQPYLKAYAKKGLVQYDINEFPNSNYITQFSWYIGNTPRLAKEKILWLTNVLNNV